MESLLQAVRESITTLGGDWAKYSVVGSFLLYVLGYLVQRFHLAALGITTDLAVLDDRYIYSGAGFMVQLILALCKLAMLALLALPLAWVLHFILPKPPLARAAAWLTQPARLACLGLLFAVFMIQSVLRQCFRFGNLLLAPELPAEPVWLRWLLLNPGGDLMQFYFAAIVAAAVLTLAVLRALRGQPLSGGARLARQLLVFLASVQLLMLPVNYGWLSASKSLARLASVGDRPLANGEQAWLVWEGKGDITYLVRNRERRVLLTVPRSEVKRLEIIGFEKILPVLHPTSRESRR